MREVVHGIESGLICDMAIGIAIAAVGVPITLLTFKMASSGGRYIFACGPVVVGGIYLLRALWGWTQLPRI
jgi:hypothetical protein